MRKVIAATIKSAVVTGSILALILAWDSSAWAQAQTSPRITTAINAGQMATLAGNTRPEAIPQNDLGLVADSLPLEHILLQLRRSPAQEQALSELIDQLHDPASPNFHQWLTAQDFGQKFGLAQQDLDTLTKWLQSYGFTVNVVYPNGMLIDFSGTAGQVRAAFRTEIHALSVNGTAHIANMSDPQLPAALMPAVAGIVSLHDFRPRQMKKVRSNYTSGASQIDSARGPGHHLQLESAFFPGHYRRGPNRGSDRRHQRLQRRGLGHLPFRIRSFRLSRLVHDGAPGAALRH